MRQLLRVFLRLLLAVFFRRIEVAGSERVPRHGGLLFAVNHPNGLLDPLFLVGHGPRRVSFLAKEPLFHMPFVGWIVRWLGCLPVFRVTDGRDPRQNLSTFAAARNGLAHGYGLAIFPEGASHGDPHRRPLKSGGARIALGVHPVSGAPPLRIVPTGLYYRARNVFRSDALVVFGDPIPVEPSPLDEAGEPPAADVHALTERIAAGLDALLLQASSREELELTARAEKIFTDIAEQPLAEELELRRRFVEGRHELLRIDPERLARLERRLARFEAELAAAGLEPSEIELAQTPRAGLLARAAGELVVVLTLFPLALAGMILHVPAWGLVGWLAKQFSRGEEDVVATVKVLAGLLCLPSTWILAGLAGSAVSGPVAGLVVALASPVIGAIALFTLERLDRAAATIRALLFAANRSWASRRLLVERRWLRAEILALGERVSRIAA